MRAARVALPISVASFGNEGNSDEIFAPSFAISNKLMQSGYDRLTPVAFHDAVPTQQRLPEAHARCSQGGAKSGDRRVLGEDILKANAKARAEPGSNVGEARRGILRGLQSLGARRRAAGAIARRHLGDNLQADGLSRVFEAGAAAIGAPHAYHRSCGEKKRVKGASTCRCGGHDVGGGCAACVSMVKSQVEREEALGCHMGAGIARDKRLVHVWRRQQAPPRWTSPRRRPPHPAPLHSSTAHTARRGTITICMHLIIRGAPLRAIRRNRRSGKCQSARRDLPPAWTGNYSWTTYLIESMTLERKWHEARIERLSAIRPSSKRPWESTAKKTRTAFGHLAPGVHVSPNGEVLLLWYRCGWRGEAGRTCVALSRDGFNFTFPTYGNTAAASSKKMVMHQQRVGTNIVLQSRSVEAFEVAYDHLSKPPRFVALRMEWMTGGKRVAPYTAYESADGVRWKKSQWVEPLVMADRSTFFLNPLRDPPVWAFSLRENLCKGGPSGHMRARRCGRRPVHGGDKAADGVQALHTQLLSVFRGQARAQRAGPMVWH